MRSGRIDWVGTTDLHHILQTTAGMPLLKSNAARTTRNLFLTVLWFAYNSSELVMLQSELLGFLEKTADAAFCVNEQGDICSWNTAAEKLFGYSSAEAIGKSCHGLLRG